MCKGTFTLGLNLMVGELECLYNCPPIGGVHLAFERIVKKRYTSKWNSVRSLMLALRLLPPQLILPLSTVGHQFHPRRLHDPRRGWARWDGDTSPKHQELKQEEHNHPDSTQREFRHQENRQRETRHHEPQAPKCQKPGHEEPKLQKLSLFEELFPEEANKALKPEQNAEQHIPRLPLPDLDQADEQDRYIGDQGRPRDVTKAASKAAFRQWNLAILVLQRASKSLSDSDFRLIAPKGQHIGDWKGPGDPLKGVILQNLPAFLLAH